MVVIRTECAEAKPPISEWVAPFAVVIRTECAEAKYTPEQFRRFYAGCDLHAVR